MCGRFSLSEEAEAIAARFHVQLPDVPIRPNYNAAPGQELLTITNDDPSLITLSTWGFVPAWAAGRANVKPVINARAETVGTKPFFRQAFKTKRCLVLNPVVLLMVPLFERTRDGFCLSNVFVPHPLMRHGKYVPVVILSAHSIFHREPHCIL
jgi:hypothetical protein